MELLPIELTSIISTFKKIVSTLNSTLTILHQRSTLNLSTSSNNLSSSLSSALPSPTYLLSGKMLSPSGDLSCPPHFPSMTVKDPVPSSNTDALPNLPSKISSSPSPVSSPSPSAVSPHRFAHILVRKNPGLVTELLEVRVACTGNVDAGKSTLLGVLTKGSLDDGRGKARVNLFRHKHEVESGRTSAVGLEIMGFDSSGDVVTGEMMKKTNSKVTWDDICQNSSKVISFIDLAGHERYLKTTIFGMTACCPDFVMLMVRKSLFHPFSLYLSTHLHFYLPIPFKW